jgi:hypothetical protein
MPNARALQRLLQGVGARAALARRGSKDWRTMILSLSQAVPKRMARRR